MSEKDKESSTGKEPGVDAAVWEKVVDRPEFGRLLAAKKRFIVPACVFFLLYYFALIVLVGYYPDLAKQIGPANLAYWFALSQFFMAWIVAWVYVRAAGRFDRLADAILVEHASSDSSKK